MNSQIMRSGKGGIKHRPPIAPNDLILIYNYLNAADPKSLQRKVLFTILFMMCRRGAENIHEQKKTTFAVKVDSDNVEYLVQVSVF